MLQAFGVIRSRNENWAFFRVELQSKCCLGFWEFGFRVWDPGFTERVPLKGPGRVPYKGSIRVTIRV